MSGGDAADRRRLSDVRRAAEAVPEHAERAYERRPTQVAGPYLREFQYEPVVLEQIVASLGELGRFSRGSLTVERCLAASTSELVSKVVVKVLTAQLPPERVEESTLVEFRRPATWWEHFKETYQDRWWLRRLVLRWPVRWEREQRVVRVVVDMTRVLAFPKADIRPPAAFGPPVDWVKWKSYAREVR